MTYNKLASLALTALLATAAIGPPQAQAGDRRARGDDLDATQARASSNTSVANSVYVSRWQADRPRFPNRWLVTPYDRVGVFYEPHLSCWTWVPMNSGWQRVWECKNPERVTPGQFVPPFAKETM